MKMRKLEEHNNRPFISYSRSPEGKLVEFHKTKTILMKLQADSLINFFFA